MMENERRLEELGIKNLVVKLKGQTTIMQQSNDKDKVSPDGDDEYIPENEDEDGSDDTSEV